jgi:hypothetical protein
VPLTAPPSAGSGTQLAFAKNVGVTLTADSQALADAAGDPTLVGHIAQFLCRFVMTGDKDRPGPVWIDETGRLRAWAGWHDLTSTGSVHRGWEIKRSVPLTDPYNPDEMVTSLSIRTEDTADANSRYAPIILNWLKEVELNWGHYRPDTPLRLRFKSPTLPPNADGTNPGSTGDVFVIAPQVVSSDGSLQVDFDLGIGSDASDFAANRSGLIRFFRNVDVGTGTPSIVVYKGDGTNTEALRLNAKTGELDLHGALKVLMGDGSSFSLAESAAGQFDLDVLPVDGTSQSIKRHGRNVNTSGTREDRYYKGDGSSTITAKIDRAAGQLYGLGQDGVTLQKAVLADDPKLPKSAPGYASLAADFSKTSDAAAADVMSVAVVANATYVIDADLIATGATTGDLALSWSLPAGATLDWIPGGPSTSASSASSTPPDIGARSAGSTANVGMVGANIMVRPHGILRVGATAGNLTLRAAQAVADATATTIKAGSILRAQRVA